MRESENNVRAVERALQILDCYTTGKASYSLMELSRKIMLSPTTTLRLVTTLENNHYLYRDENNLKYHLGFKLAQLSNISFSNLDFCRIARPYLQELHEVFDETVGFYIVNKDQRVCVERLESTKSLRSVVQVGDRKQLTRGASGRLLLAYLPEEKIVELLKEDPFTNLEELAEIRRLGYTVSYGERETGVTSMAVPIFDAHGNVVAALFLTGPSQRIDKDCEVKMVQYIKDIADKISVQMGYRKTE